VAEPFLYPVDSKVFPEYYMAIKRPMDLDTLRESVSSCGSLEEFVATARLIWENCRAFNDPCADIVAQANELAYIFKENIAVNFISIFCAMIIFLIIGKIW